MYLRVEFNSKNEYSIDYDLRGLYENYSTTKRELLLLATYLSRIFINLGTNPVGKVLSLILVDSSPYDLLAISRYEEPFPTASHIHSVSVARDMVYGQAINIDYDIIELINQEILMKRPHFVENGITGSKRLDLTLSPCIMKLKGFGLLGIGFNYCALHSVFGLIRKVADNNKDKSEISLYIKRVVENISLLYLKNSLTPFVNAEFASLEVLNSQNIN
jgi:hypothetical protein